jgi:hypothetical protein
MYIEPLGAALLGLKRGLDLEVEHHFLPVEILEGCV